MLTLYGDIRSGNCLKVKWLLDWLGRDYRWIAVDILTGGSRTPEFLALNTAGQVPTLVFADGRPLAQSNASSSPSPAVRSSFLWMTTTGR